MGIIDGATRARTILLVGVGSLALVASACGSDGATASSSPAPGASSTSAGSATASPGAGTRTDEEQRRRLEAKVVADAPPANLTWRHLDVPSSWTVLATETGTQQWRPGSSSCGIALSQPSGVGSGKAPTSAQVVDKMVSDLAGTLPGDTEPTVVKQGTLMLPALVTGLDAEASVTVAARRVRFSSAAEGLFYGYRSGDFALEFSAVCGSGQYDKLTSTSAFQAFAAGLTVSTTY